MLEVAWPASPSSFEEDTEGVSSSLETLGMVTEVSEVCAEPFEADGPEAEPEEADEEGVYEDAGAGVDGACVIAGGPELGGIPTFALEGGVEPAPGGALFPSVLLAGGSGNGTDPISLRSFATTEAAVCFE